ncbi:MAG: hypothetical protein AAGA60_25705 [Cyanobacteria bacterium P01_E01_bin.42]
MTQESPKELEMLYRAIAQTRSRLERYSENRQVSAIETENFPPSLMRLRDRFDLSPFEAKILLLCAGMELDPQFPQLCAEASNNPQANYPTFALALSLFSDAEWGVLAVENPLQSWQLVQIASHPVITQAPLSLDRRILSYLLNIPDRDRNLKGWIYPVTEKSIPLPPSYEAIATEAIETWSMAMERLPILQLCGTSRGDKQAEKRVEKGTWQTSPKRIELSRPTTL